MLSPPLRKPHASYASGPTRSKEAQPTLHQETQALGLRSSRGRAGWLSCGLRSSRKTLSKPRLSLLLVAKMCLSPGPDPATRATGAKVGWAMGQAGRAGMLPRVHPVSLEVPACPDLPREAAAKPTRTGGQEGERQGLSLSGRRHSQGAPRDTCPKVPACPEC